MRRASPIAASTPRIAWPTPRVLLALGAALIATVATSRTGENFFLFLFFFFSNFFDWPLCSVADSSSAPNTLGTCVSYPSGSCVAMTDAELLSPSLPAEWKCATFYTDDQNVTHIDWKGFCAQNRCLACDPGPQALPSLGVPAVCAVPGNGPKRVCAFPGYWVSGDRVAWMSAIYANDVASIWLAMIFTLLLLIVIGWTVSGILACTRERQSKSV